MYFSTNAFDRSVRQDAWRQAIDVRCGPFQTNFGSSNFEGSIDARPVGGLDCARIMQTAGEAKRGKREVACGKKDDYLIILQLAGASLLEQAEGSARMAAGDLTIIDCARPSTFRFETKSVHLSVHIPRQMLDASGASWDSRLATLLPRPSAALVGTLLRVSFEQACQLSADEEQALRDSVVRLIAAGWAVPRAEANDRYAGTLAPSLLLREIQGYALGHLHDEALTPKMIARAHRISERQLHRIFEAVGSTVCRWIRQARLDRCAADLADPAKQSRTITELAFAAGFNDAAHFSRLFRSEFGQSPSEFRARSINRAPGLVH